MVERPKQIERGQSITFRVPSDTPDYLLKQLTRLKEKERRNFSSQIAQFVLKGVNETNQRNRETITIPLPKALSKEQKSWLKHEHSEALIGTILYQLLSDPLRASALLASMNSGASNIDEALYLQEETVENFSVPDFTYGKTAKQAVNDTKSEEEILQDEQAMDDIDMDHLFDDIHPEKAAEPEEELEEEDPLGDFFANMNK